ncbi:MAG TPA: hypothetical protein VFR37_05360 [Longimicrobium sp.]|nr:hypothetical protein [Longimicrobium sp.]
MPDRRFKVYAPAQGYFLSTIHRSSELAYIVGHAGEINVAEGENPMRTLSRIFAEGNGEGEGTGFTVNRRSMSVGDVVHLEPHGAYLCGPEGFTALAGAEASRFPLGESPSSAS